MTTDENLIRTLRNVATGKIQHTFREHCPDEINGRDSRDADCPACKVIAAADARLRPPAPESGEQPVAYVNSEGFIVEIEDVLISPGEKLYTRPAPWPAVTREMLEKWLEEIEGCVEDGGAPKRAIGQIHAILSGSAPEQRELSNEDIRQAWDSVQGTRNGYVPFARAVIAADARMRKPAPERQGLTDAEIKDLVPDGDGWKFDVGFDDAIEFARAIERAHGIGQSQKGVA